MTLFKLNRIRNIYAKLDRMKHVLTYFLTNEWDINNDNLIKLWNKLSEQDKQLFNFDINSIVLETYFINLLTGLKKYILKEDMSKTSSHLRRYKR